MSLKYAILAAISAKPQSGYDLGAEIEGSIGFFWNATRQQIYRELGELEATAHVAHKDVRQQDRPDKKVYQITAEGMQDLKNWIESETDKVPLKDPLLIKVFVGHLVEPEKLLIEIDRQRQIHSEKLKLFLWFEAEHLRGPNSSSLRHQFQHLALRRGILAEKGWISWAKEVHDFLESRISDSSRRKASRKPTKEPLP